MKTEMDITYIFIRYVTVTLKRQANAFYKNQGKIFSHESKELTEFNQNEQSGELWLNEQGFTPEEIFEMNFEKERLRLSLSYLTNEELFILSEKYSKKLSDANIGKKLHVSSQMVSKKKRKAFAKLKEFLLL
ncbi:sigma-70 family RNA polymerase sigma factor [Listeria monocytogenes]|uniref:sigma-70 family RNA polymerase sigma factor n=1 Tax=Listeria monocytogenes TaxID=1639 RepID=UPI0010B4088F|nr:sigma-70 family RNA polymerase sigma factor [Listeria monocytogenes]EAC5805743.1 sigma-70 family RNA polymerase sigma factor [Listeria monocytogenes]EAC9482204.1 sigma-70 family RNA polymerase sigma factor [Listeria monocytogenes]MDA5916547.1 sigma-70 family RNA polymerase sigma factor [Listeria monocytogenes]HAB8284929.1 sigma-70 family RNA polymerase sigma factor [Listeria monocytogenes]HAC0404106.1 sigma-70 family RNA polymerase sigma factor [Listeria monocytogenes]